VRKLRLIIFALLAAQLGMADGYITFFDPSAGFTTDMLGDGLDPFCNVNFSSPDCGVVVTGESVGATDLAIFGPDSAVPISTTITSFTMGATPTTLGDRITYLGFEGDPFGRTGVGVRLQTNYENGDFIPVLTDGEMVPIGTITWSDGQVDVVRLAPDSSVKLVLEPSSLLLLASVTLIIFLIDRTLRARS